jgi:hypothetical protein
MKTDAGDILKAFLMDKLGNKASAFLIKRMLSLIEDSASRRTYLIVAVGKIEKIIALFIDVNLAENISRDLNNLIEEHFSLSAGAPGLGRISDERPTTTNFDKPPLISIGDRPE